MSFKEESKETDQLAERQMHEVRVKQVQKQERWQKRVRKSLMDAEMSKQRHAEERGQWDEWVDHQMGEAKMMQVREQEIWEENTRDSLMEAEMSGQRRMRVAAEQKAERTRIYAWADKMARQQVEEETKRDGWVLEQLGLTEGYMEERAKMRLKLMSEAEEIIQMEREQEREEKVKIKRKELEDETKKAIQLAAKIEEAKRLYEEEEMSYLEEMTLSEDDGDNDYEDEEDEEEMTRAASTLARKVRFQSNWYSRILMVLPNLYEGVLWPGTRDQQRQGGLRIGPSEFSSCVNGLLCGLMIFLIKRQGMPKHPVRI